MTAGAGQAAFGVTTNSLAVSDKLRELTAADVRQALAAMAAGYSTASVTMGHLAPDVPDNRPLSLIRTQPGAPEAGTRPASDAAGR